MDVFGRAMQSSAFLCDAALAAGHELGVFEALRSGGAAPVEPLADALGVSGRRRLRALLDVLVALGAIRRHPPLGAAAPGTGAAMFAAAATVPLCPVVARAGWGLLAEVIRSDRALPADLTDDAVRRLHGHLAAAGAAAGCELVAQLAGESLLDLGAGAGAYSRAFLEAHPAGRVTLVDRAEVLALAAEHLGALAARARFVDGDAAEIDLGTGHAVALLANLLHLHSPGRCARLCVAAARAVAPGGVVAIKDLRVDDDRSGPIEGLLFALNMALYTDAGDVYSTAQLRTWLADAGLIEIVEHRLAAAPDAIVVSGRRSRESGEPTPGAAPARQ